MMNRLMAFLEDNRQARKAKFVGAVAALCGLFVSISPPGNTDAKTALAVIQLFWLVLLTLGLTSLFFDFVKFVWHAERVASHKYDVPFSYVFTGMFGLILGGVVLNLWRYIIDLYSDVLAVFTVMIGFPCFVMIACIFVAIVIRKYEEKVPPVLEIFADSIALGLLAGVAGLYIEVGITKLFYPFWLTRIAPVVAGVCFVFGIMAMLHCGRSFLTRNKY